MEKLLIIYKKDIKQQILIICKIKLLIITNMAITIIYVFSIFTNNISKKNNEYIIDYCKILSKSL